MDLRNHAYDKSTFVTTQEGRKMAEKFKSDYVECSALTREGLKEAFERPVRTVLMESQREQKMVKSVEGNCNCQLI